TGMRNPCATTGRSRSAAASRAGAGFSNACLRCGDASPAQSSRRPASTRRRLRGHGVATEATRAVAPADQLRVRATNPIHQRLIVDEERYWARADFNAFFARAIEATREMGNRALTGRPDRDSLDDLGARGPFGRAALLGHEHGLGQRWMRTQPGTSTLDGVRSEPGRDRASAVA